MCNLLKRGVSVESGVNVEVTHPVLCNKSMLERAGETYLWEGLVTVVGVARRHVGEVVPVDSERAESTDRSKVWTELADSLSPKSLEEDRFIAFAKDSAVPEQLTEKVKQDSSSLVSVLTVLHCSLQCDSSG